MIMYISHWASLMDTTGWRCVSNIRQLTKAMVADYSFKAKCINLIFIKDKQNALEVPKYGTLRSQAYQIGNRI